MRLLIITQKIDEQDAVLGFMHGWIAEFARQTDSVVVICLEKGTVALPANVRVFSLGKEKNELGIRNYELWKRVKYSWRFIRYIVQFRKEYDAVFVHMNPEYILLGGLFWKLWGKTVSLWYAHKSVPWHLRLAHTFTDIVFTSTASGFRLKSAKVKIVGQGIDAEKFKAQNEKRKVEDGTFKIVTVGRITPSKDYETLIDAIETLRKKTATPFQVEIVGPTSVDSDKAYFESLKEKISQKGLGAIITFRGPIANDALPEFLATADLFVNMGHTGSLDKAVLEAMSSGIPALTCNEAYTGVLGHYRGLLMYPKRDLDGLVGTILHTMGLSEEKRNELGNALREIVVRDHSLKSFVQKIVSIINTY